MKEKKGYIYIFLEETSALNAKPCFCFSHSPAFLFFLPKDGGKRKKALFFHWDVVDQMRKKRFESLSGAGVRVAKATSDLCPSTSWDARLSLVLSSPQVVLQPEAQVE